MNSISASSIDWSLYAIIDPTFLKNHSIESVTQQLCDGGCGIIQYRDKMSTSRKFYDNALCVHQITKKKNVPLIINDRVDIALAVDAEGVHLGQGDMPWEIARQLLGHTKIIGGSVHSQEEFNCINQCDYLGVGAMYPTNTKKDVRVNGLDLLKYIRQKTNLPLVGIGGITIENASSVIQAGADGVAIISWLMKERGDDVKERTRQIIQIIQSIKINENKME